MPDDRSVQRINDTEYMSGRDSDGKQFGKKSRIIGADDLAYALFRGEKSKHHFPTRYNSVRRRNFISVKESS